LFDDLFDPFKSIEKSEPNQLAKLSMYQISSNNSFNVKATSHPHSPPLPLIPTNLTKSNQFPQLQLQPPKLPPKLPPRPPQIINQQPAFYDQHAHVCLETNQIQQHVSGNLENLDTLFSNRNSVKKNISDIDLLGDPFP
jgi:hypothetical protein